MGTVIPIKFETKTERSVVKLKELNFLYAPTGEQLVGILFPGYGAEVATQPDSITGKSSYAARFDHTHFSDDIKETQDTNPNTKVTISRKLRDKLDKLPDVDQLNQLINEKIEHVDWKDVVNTYADLQNVPEADKVDGATYGVLLDSTYNGKPYPAGTYRYHDADEHITGDTSGFKLISISTTPLANNQYAGTISSDWFTKIDKILGTGFEGLVAADENGDAGKVSTAARSDHKHSNYLQNRTGLSDTSDDKSQKLGTNLIVPESFYLSTDTDKFLVVSQTLRKIQFGSINKALEFSSRDATGENIVYTRGNNTGFIWDSFNLPKATVDSIVKGGAFPGYAGTGDDWGSAKTVARSDHKHNYFELADTAKESGKAYFAYKELRSTASSLAFAIKKADSEVYEVCLSFVGNAITVGDYKKNINFLCESDLMHFTAVANYKIWDARNLPEATVNTLTDIANNGVSKIKNALKISLNGGLTEGTDLFTYDGSSAKNINLTAATFGAAPANHTHNYAGSASAGGSANSTKGAFSITVGSNAAVSFNGSENKSVSITASSIGAAASSHTHSYLPLSGGTMSGEINMGGKQITNCANILFSSDERLKHGIRRFGAKQDEEKTKSVFDIPAYDFRFKYDTEQRLHCGYIAQKVNEVAPEFVGVNEKGTMSVDYTSIHTKKIAILEDMIRELREEIVMLKKNLK